MSKEIFDPEKHIQLREWCNDPDVDIRINHAIGTLNRWGVLIKRVGSPYVKGLRDAKESWSPDVMVVDVEYKPQLDKLAQQKGGAKRYNQDVKVKWKWNNEESFSHLADRYDVDYVYGSIEQNGVKNEADRIPGVPHLPEYIFRPPVLEMEFGGPPKSTEGFNWLPSMMLKDGPDENERYHEKRRLVFFSHRRANMDKRFLTVNGKTLGEKPELDPESLSNVPGTAKNIGVYTILLAYEEWNAVLRGHVHGQYHTPLEPPKPRPEPESKPEAKDKPNKDKFVDATATVEFTQRGSFWRSSKGEWSKPFSREGERPVFILAPGNRLKAWTDDSSYDHIEAKINGVFVDFKRTYVGGSPYVAELLHEVIERLKNSRIPIEPLKLQTSERILHERKLYTSEQVNEEWAKLGVAMNPVLLDRQYVALPQAVWDEIIAKDDIDSKVYVSELFDCDDFAFGLKAAASRQYDVNGCGLVVSVESKHAFSVMLVREPDDSLSFRFLEPQTDDWVSTDDPNYSLESGFVLF